MGKESKTLTVLLAALLALLALSSSIAAPILCRPFYYAQIAPLGLAEKTDLSPEEIRQAYDETVDFCLGLRGDFSAGTLPWSESGRGHFVDVRRLFLLDLAVLTVSGALCAVSFLPCVRKRVRPRRIWGRGPGFFAAAGLGVSISVIGLLAVLDFDQAFTLFHILLFPGKDNWILNSDTDGIIRILPAEFFQNCALLIAILLLLWCAFLLTADRRAGSRACGRSPGRAARRKGR